MYGLLLAVVGEAVALGAIVLNRLAITLVEAVLLLVGVLLLRRRRHGGARGFRSRRHRRNTIARAACGGRH